MTDTAIMRAGDALPTRSAPRAVHHTEAQQREIAEKLRVVEAMRQKIELQGFSKEAAAQALEREGAGTRSTLLRWWKRRTEDGGRARWRGKLARIATNRNSLKPTRG